ncbi:GerAB/ArcD/ProY family transporter [Alicyclobacillus sp. ALC3]|uniref:GerAB/ArcD/ProY family transporter n=1 Tax=Alicyclobacillus sp. ALC3 TaxID=2796143 RepID=UPI0023783397|nr:GerAB/ArcD/ProY family transporter [Alicyclobacillus sp. ALC3]WDL97922.1 GerAB/ArcD/ProY family transporter [Alicyclobacillus sp. ALC3]
MNKPKTVTQLQLGMSIGTAIIGVGILAFPRITVTLVSTGAPLTTLIAVFAAVLGGLMLAYLGNRYPDETIYEYADHLVGKWVGSIVLLLIGSYFLELTALAAREFGEVVVTSVLPRTPVPVTILVILILVVIASRNDIAKFVRILTFYMPIVYFPALVIVVLSLKSARVENVMPVLGLFHGVSFQNIVVSTGVVTALFQNFMITGLIIPFMYQPKRAWKSTTLGIVVAGSLYIILIYSTLGVFGLEEIKNLLWPTLELAKTAALPAFFVERLDPVFLAVWVTAVFCAMFAAYYLSIKAFSHIFRFQDHRALALMGLPVALVLSRQPSNIVELYTVVKNIGLAGLPLTLGYPLVLTVLSRFKTHQPQSKRRGVGAA